MAVRGHSQRSNIIGEYQRFGDEDLKEMQLEYNGVIKKEDKKELERKPIKCSRCSNVNEHDAEFCTSCQMALTQKRMVESSEKIKQMELFQENMANKMNMLLEIFKESPEATKLIVHKGGEKLKEIFR